MTGKKTEKELDKALANALEHDSELVSWIVSKTKFAGRDIEFHGCRSNYIWGVHPFVSKNLETGLEEKTLRESETDVLLLLKDGDRVIALHIENKLGSGAFTKLQPEMYPQRAEHWKNDEKRGGYADFDTVLVAPLVFKERNAEQAALFGCFISHAEIAAFIPAFGQE
jgi:hypothetical protein